jgi:hypothetical protein
MAVAVGASCAFLTPIGHQNNTLILGPGGFRFGDYWRLGMPLQLLVIAVSIPMLLLVWPLLRRAAPGLDYMRPGCGSCSAMSPRASSGSPAAWPCEPWPSPARSSVMPASWHRMVGAV